MYIQQLDYGAKPDSAWSDLYFNSLSIFYAPSIHHFSHHHEHLAH